MYKKQSLTMHSMLIFLLGFCLLQLSTADDLLELDCISDEHCAKYVHGHCVLSRCVCTPRGSTSAPVECKPQVEKLSNIIGGPCPCSQPNAECDTQQQQCACAMDHLPSVDRRRCMPKHVPLNETCELSRQCQLADTFAVCHNKRCICKEHFELHGGKCLALLDLSCSNNTYCESVGASICLPQAQKCACAADSVPNHNMTICIAGAAYNSSCTTPAQCQLQLGAGGTCSNNHCSCRNKHYPQTKPGKQQQITCEPIVPYGAYCRRNEDCQQADVERAVRSSMHCKWGECRCRDDHRLVDNEFCVLYTGGAGVKQLDNYWSLLFMPTIWLIIYACI